MPRIKIDSKKSMYGPIEIEVDGQVIDVGTIDKDRLEKMDEFEKQTDAGDPIAIYKQLVLVTNGKITLERARKMDVRDVRKVVEWVAEAITTPTKFEEKEKKKEEKPDKVKSP